MKTYEERIADLKELVWMVGLYALVAGFIAGYAACKYITA